MNMQTYINKMSLIIKKPIAHIFFIVFLGILIYSNTFHAPFVWDDQRLIIQNPFVKGIWNSSGAAKKNEELYKHNKQRYIAMITFALNYKINGFNVLGFHIVNLVIHLLNAIIFYWLILMTFQTMFLRGSPLKNNAEFIAVCAGLFFVSHPVQTEAVTYIFQRQTSLATFFYILSLSLYVKSGLYLQEKDLRIEDEVNYKAWSFAARSAFCYIGALISTILGMFTKEITITIPIAITLYELLFFKGSSIRGIKKLFPFWLTLPIIPLYYIFGLDRSFSNATREYSFITYGRLEYLFTQFRVISRYFHLLILPTHQNIDYDFPIYRSFLNANVYLSLLLIVILFAAGVYFLRRSNSGNRGFRLIAFGIFWFFISLSIESSIFPLRLLINEYRIYLPSIGFFLSLSSAVFIVYGRLRNSIARIGMILVIILGLTGYSFAAYKRNSIWADEEELWQDTVKESPKKFVSYYNLAMLYMQQGRYQAAFNMIQAFLKLKPADVLAHRSLGIFYDDLGRFDDAKAEFEAIVRDNQDDDRAHYDLGIANGRLGRYGDAIAEFRKALALNPGFADAHMGIGIVYDEQGLYKDALREFQVAVSINPDDDKAHENLGITYVHQGRFSEAEKEFNIALALAPDSVEARRYLALINDQRKGTR